MLDDSGGDLFCRTYIEAAIEFALEYINVKHWELLVDPRGFEPLTF